MSDTARAPLTGNPRVGVRKTPTLASIVAATTTTMLYQITPARTAIIRKMWAINRNVASARLRIGSTDSATGGVGGVFTQRLPEILLLSGQDVEFGENDLPGYEFRRLEAVNTDIVAQSPQGAAAPNDVQIMVEVEEFEL